MSRDSSTPPTNATEPREYTWFPWDSEATIRLPVLALPDDDPGWSSSAGGTRVRLRDRVTPPGGVAGRKLAVMAMVDAIGTGAVLAVTVIFLTRKVGLSVGAVGGGLALAAALALVSTIPIGSLADRYGARRVLVLVTAWRAACYAVYPLINNFTGFIVVVCLLALVDRTAGPMTQALIGEVVEERERVRTMAVMRSLRNIGFTLGAMGGAVALAFDTRAAYATLLFANAASFAVVAVIAARLPIGVAKASGTLRRTVSFRVLRDRPYVALAVLNGILTLHMPLLSMGIPLWIADHSQAPRVIVAPLLAVNTVLAVAFQVRASRGSETAHGASRCLRMAGFALLGCCLFLALVPTLPRLAAIGVLILSIMALTAGELLQAAGGWGVSYELAKQGQQGAYLSLFWLGISLQQIVAPLLIGLVLQVGPLGWVSLGALMAAAGLAVPAVTRWAVATRQREMQIGIG